MQINSNMIRDLREKTGAGIMECKDSLIRANGNLDIAIVYLREKGLADAVKKNDRITSEGSIGIVIDKKRAAIMEVSCETDFVSRNSEFKNLVAQLTKRSLYEADIMISSANLINESIVKMKEKIAIRRHTLLQDGDFYAAYIHGAGSIGALVEFKGLFDEVCHTSLIKDIAMHIAASSPLFLSRLDIDNKTIESERSIFQNQLLAQKKPDNIVERIIKGKMEKYYSEVCLLEQKFIKDQDKSVRDLIEGSGLRVSNFKRFQVGEAIK